MSWSLLERQAWEELRRGNRSKAVLAMRKALGVAAESIGDSKHRKAVEAKLDRYVQGLDEGWIIWAGDGWKEIEKMELPKLVRPSKITPQNVWPLLVGEQNEFHFVLERREEVDAGKYPDMKSAVIGFAKEELEELGEMGQLGVAADLLLKRIATWQKSRKNQQFKALTDEELAEYIG